MSILLRGRFIEAWRCRLLKHGRFGPLDYDPIEESPFQYVHWCMVNDFDGLVGIKKFRARCNTARHRLVQWFSHPSPYHLRGRRWELILSVGQLTIRVAPSPSEDRKGGVPTYLGPIHLASVSAEDLVGSDANDLSLGYGSHQPGQEDERPSTASSHHLSRQTERCSVGSRRHQLSDAMSKKKN